jgi:hypothetical protein
MVAYGLQALQAFQSPVYPTGDSSGVGDLAVITNALASGNSVIQLAPGNYFVNAPLVVPSGVRLCGTAGDVNDVSVLGTTINTPHASWAQGSAPFPAAVILNSDSQCDTFNLNCHFANNNGMDGITSNNASNVLIHDLNIYNGPATGVTTRGNTWRGERVMVTQAVVACFAAGASDSDWIDCNASASQSNGWTGNNPINNHFVGCRAEFNAGDGFHFTCDNTSTGGFSLVGCSTDRNAGNGLFFSSTGTAPLLISGMTQRRDGSAGSGSAINIAANCTSPVLIDGHVIFPGFNDDGSGSDTPVTGITIGATPTYVSLSNVMVHAVTTAVSGTPTNNRALATRTGAWNSPSAMTLVADNA